MYRNKAYYNEIGNIVQYKDLDWTIMNGKCILVIGATGMIGSYIIDLLMAANDIYRTNIRVIALSRSKDKLQERFSLYKDRREFHLLVHDITDKMQFEGDVPDYIIHAAGNTHPMEYSLDPVGTITANVLGMYNVFEYIRNHNHNCRPIILSSVEIYGECDKSKEKLNEFDSGYIDCNTLRAGYPESKRLCESMLQAYIKQYGLGGVVIRLCRIYGPTLENDDSKALTQFIRKAANNEDIVLKSDGSQRYSFLYLADAARAVLTVMLKGETGEVYNAASSASDITLLEVANILAKLSGTKVVYEKAGEVESRGYSKAVHAVLDASKITQQLGWEAAYDIREGLDRTLRIIKDESL